MVASLPCIGGQDGRCKSLEGYSAATAAGSSDAVYQNLSTEIRAI